MAHRDCLRLIGIVGVGSMSWWHVLACAVTLYWGLDVHGFSILQGRVVVLCFLAVYVSLFVSAIAEQLSSSMHGRLLRGFAWLAVVIPSWLRWVCMAPSFLQGQAAEILADSSALLGWQSCSSSAAPLVLACLASLYCWLWSAFLLVVHCADGLCILLVIVSVFLWL